MKKFLIMNLIFLLFLLIISTISPNIFPLYDSLHNTEDNLFHYNPKFSINSNDSSNPTSFNHRIDFTINASIPTLYYVATAYVTSNGFFSTYLNTSNSLVVDLFVYGKNGFSSSPITQSQNINHSNPGLITFNPWKEPIDQIKQQAFIKVYWISGSGNVSLWAENTAMDPLPQQTSYSTFSTFSFYNQLVIIPLNYTGGESLSFHSFFAYNFGGPSNYNYSLYIFAGTANKSEVLNSSQVITGSLDLSVPIVPDMTVNDLVAIYVPQIMDSGLNFGAYELVSQGNLTNYASLSSKQSYSNNFQSSSSNLIIYQQSASFNLFYLQTQNVKIFWQIFADDTLSHQLYNGTVNPFSNDSYMKDTLQPLIGNPAGFNYYYIKLTPLDGTTGDYKLFIDSELNYLDAASTNLHQSYVMSATDVVQLRPILMSFGYQYDLFVIPSLTLGINVHILSTNSGLNQSLLSLTGAPYGYAEVQPSYSVSNYDIYFFMIVPENGSGSYQINLNQYHDFIGPSVSQVQFPSSPIEFSSLVNISLTESDSGTGIMNNTLQIRKNSTQSWQSFSPIGGPTDKSFLLPYGYWQSRLLVFDYAENVNVVMNGLNYFYLNITDSKAPMVIIKNVVRISTVVSQVSFVASEGLRESGIYNITLNYSYDNITFFSKNITPLSQTIYLTDINITNSTTNIYLRLMATDFAGNSNDTGIKDFILVSHYIFLSNVQITTKDFSNFTIGTDISSSDPVTNVLVRYYYDNYPNQIYSMNMTAISTDQYSLLLKILNPNSGNQTIFFQIEAINSANNMTYSKWYSSMVVPTNNSMVNSKTGESLTLLTNSTSNSLTSIPPNTNSQGLLLIVALTFGILAVGGGVLYRYYLKKKDKNEITPGDGSNKNSNIIGVDSLNKTDMDELKDNR